MQSDEWLLFAPQLPASPSSLRVMVWRRMQGSGALLLQNGLWILPHTAEHADFITKVIASLEKQQGSGWFFISKAGDELQQQRLVENFQAERQQEYTELGKRGDAFLAHQREEVLAQQWTFASLEAYEHALHNLTSELRKIQQRDFFPTVHSQAAIELHAQCSQAVYEYAIATYTQYNQNTPRDYTI
ncbi:Chromate resistance protein ChrB [Dictyobacter arantiisoli]|uniref:ChrB N-terminal domain-containing protein n=1 Tax=Dictyobacter arantiisoli TaxID=2014874 RepID=A0A5A5TIZ2_9CHLR|nr:Chromate resistance protein ChrB [Dictyobacter arantiisoli]GCF11387.1 hypothetical protein KDI_49510 [Dictyobacter arantiisoli]